jgi:hypothetical protein
MTAKKIGAEKNKMTAMIDPFQCIHRTEQSYWKNYTKLSGRQFFSILQLVRQLTKGNML